VAGDEQQKSALRIAIVLICIGAFVLVITILSGNRFGAESGRVVASAALLAFVTLTANAGRNLSVRQPGVAAFGYLAIVASAVALVTTLALIWDDALSSSDGGAHLTWYALIAAFALGTTSALLGGHDDLDSDAVKLTRGGTVMALWALVVALIAEIRTPGHDVDPKFLGVLAVLYLLGSVLLPLLRRLD
jgi:hypothetical protein